MRRKARKGGGRQLEAKVQRLGARGDGVAECDGRPLFLPGVLPGESLRAQITGERGGGFKGRVLELLEISPERVDPPCPHFGPCGGCALQHWADGPYKVWKAEQLTTALARQGLEPATLGALKTVSAGGRRRADFSFRRIGARTVLGFHEREAPMIVDLESCLLLTPALSDLIGPLRDLLTDCLPDKSSGELVLLESETGVDLLIRAPGTPNLEQREALAAVSESLDLARISWASTSDGGSSEAPEPVIERRAPKITFSGIEVTPQAGGFLQPSSEGEGFLVAEVLRLLPKEAETVADLYSGYGTFTFALAARGHRVHAVEGDEAALAALWSAACRSEKVSRVTIEQRDLARQPILAEELEGGDAVLFDPPRAGAREQAEALAHCDIATIIAVSCNPATFARDARILVDGGYQLEEIVPVDQFPFSGHLELVAKFTRA